MDQSALLFQFSDPKQASSAFDTLQELGYEPAYHDHQARPTLHIHVRNQDLTSALEIAQAHGGTLMETREMEQTELFNSAYGLEGIPIPAHTVNEDWQDGQSETEPAHQADVTLY